MEAQINRMMQWIADEVCGRTVEDVEKLRPSSEEDWQMLYRLSKAHDLSHLVGGEVLPLESVAYENGLVLNSKIEEHITVWGNNTQLKQLTSILVDNAIRHAFGSKEIWASLKTERGHAVLSVINSGEEITAEQRAHLFERFYRADEARTGEDKHYGLGLAIAKAIVETHHGKIEVRCYKGLVEFRATIPKL